MSPYDELIDDAEDLEDLDDLGGFDGLQGLDEDELRLTFEEIANAEGDRDAARSRAAAEANSRSWLLLAGLIALLALLARLTLIPSPAIDLVQPAFEVPPGDFAPPTPLPLAVPPIEIPE